MSDIQVETCHLFVEIYQVCYIIIFLEILSSLENIEFCSTPFNGLLETLCMVRQHSFNIIVN